MALPPAYKDEIVLSGLIPSMVYVSSEADLPPLNGASEHELQANTNYYFTAAVEIAYPLRFIATSTELSGSGIGLSKITYTGAGYGLRATNGTASIRLKFIQFISSVGDGYEFVGGGAGSGTNISLDRAYVIAQSGSIGTVTGVDIFFAEAMVAVGLDSLYFNGANNGLLYIGSSRLQSAALINIIDFGTSVFEVVTGIVIDFRGVAGSVAMSGLAGGGNVSISGQLSSCTVESGITALSGISPADDPWLFNSNVGIADSNTLGMGYIAVAADTTLIDGVAVPVAGTWTQHSETERAMVSVGGIITFNNLESAKGKVNITFSATKVGGGTADCIFKVQKQSLGAGGWVDVEAAAKPATLSSTPISITILSIGSYVDTDEFRFVAVGVATTSDISVSVTNFIVG